MKPSEVDSERQAGKKRAAREQAARAEGEQAEQAEQEQQARAERLRLLKEAGFVRNEHHARWQDMLRRLVLLKRSYGNQFAHAARAELRDCPEIRSLPVSPAASAHSLLSTIAPSLLSTIAHPLLSTNACCCDAQLAARAAPRVCHAPLGGKAARAAARCWLALPAPRLRRGSERQGPGCGE